MKLTGQTKIEFEKWLLNESGLINVSWKWFLALHYSLQWGIYQDFADSVGVEIQIAINGIPKHFGSIEYYALVEKQYVASRLKTRQEARNAAIEKFNEMYNEK